MGIAIKKSGKTKYIKQRGTAPLSYKERKSSDLYAKELKNRIKEIKVSLKKEGFFEMENNLEKWLLLGKALQFLKDSELRKMADPDLEYTWSAFYALAPELAPVSETPKDSSRVIGKRNHFLICYRLAQLSPAVFVKLPSWRDFNDIYMSLTPLAWEDADRIIEWVLLKSTEAGKTGSSKFRKALIAVRKTVGVRSKHKLYTKILSKDELFSKLEVAYKELETS